MHFSKHGLNPATAYIGKPNIVRHIFKIFLTFFHKNWVVKCAIWQGFRVKVFYRSLEGCLVNFIGSPWLYVNLSVYF